MLSNIEPHLPENFTGSTFSHIFGANTGPLEHFLVKRDIMGPCWLKIENAKLSGSNVRILLGRYIKLIIMCKGMYI